jgi:ketosteroid isomerase-like protein
MTSPISGLASQAKRDTAADMSPENVDVVRKPLRARERSRRTLDERLSLRLPRLASAYLGWIGKRRPGSRLRQASLWRGARLGVEAYNRRDLEAVVVGWDPEFEYHTGRQWAQSGLVESCYRGLDGYRKYVAATQEVWGEENYLRPVELIDLGERIVLLANVPMRAQASGVALTEAFAIVSTLKDGRIVRCQEYYDHDEALEAAGLKE